jgi:hypothetical protein
MKKLILLATVATLSLASCKKDYTCTCTTVETGFTAVTVTKAKSTKKGGEAWCEAAPSSTTTVSGVAVTGTKPTCVLN